MYTCNEMRSKLVIWLSWLQLRKTQPCAYYKLTIFLISQYGVFLLCVYASFNMCVHVIQHDSSHSVMIQLYICYYACDHGIKVIYY